MNSRRFLLEAGALVVVYPVCLYALCMAVIMATDRFPQTEKTPRTAGEGMIPAGSPARAGQGGVWGNDPARPTPRANPTNTGHAPEPVG